LEAGAVLCVNCGQHIKAGMNVKTVMRAKKAGRGGLAIAISGIVAFACAAAWAGITVALNMEIGYVAWAIGFITGLPIVLMTEERSVRTGLAAAGLALAALLMGKLLIVHWAVIPHVAEEIAKNDDALLLPVMALMSERGEFTEEQQAVLESEDASEEAVEQVLNAVRKRVREMPHNEKLELSRKLAESFASKMSVFKKIELQCSMYDILWFILALGTAFKMGSGLESD